MSSTNKGNLVPFTDPTYYQGSPSLLFNETHYAFQEEVRAFCNEFIKPYVDEWDAKGEIDPQLYIEFGKRGYLCAAAGQHKYPVEYTDVRIKSVPPEKYDFMHETILIDEVSRCGSGGAVWFLVGGYNISVPAIFTHATEEVKRKVLPDLLRGTKRSCLCITEPDAGSDVANLSTEAKKATNAKGEAGYLLSGTKKWITNGYFADYYVVACRTGGQGGKGISLVLAEHNNDAVDRHKIETQGVRGSGSSLINFDELFVPASHLLGRENDGFKGIVSNFNHERLAIVYQTLGLSRVIIEDCMSWTHQRKTFGVKLIEHAVIRQKLGVMAGRVEALQAWVNDLAYQYKTLSPQQAMIKLGGPIATCKAYATQTMELCAREGSQIFGGLSYTRGGKGGRVERIYREVRAFAIPGGSEEIMLDLGIRQSLKASRVNGAKI